ncbi:MAG: T9SS type A sorting domain-containing protein [Saprospiraceae bacterium]|nr:T9SS type A sorting domain-containing protein [Saprospiraceae bacterium]
MQKLGNKYNKIDIGAFEFFAPTDNKELANPTFIIYPNPTADWVHLELKNDELKQVKMYSLSGEFLQTFFTSDFSIAPFQNGVYFLLIQTEQQSFFTKIMKF